MGNIVAIVGRPNVGKSTLFNRLTSSRRAIVNEESGTTRDRQYGQCEWNGRTFSIIDTGGWVVNSEDIFEDEINKQVDIAIDEADIIIFMVDANNGITDLDLSVASTLRRSKKKIILATNKVDTFDLQYKAAEFYRFGLGEPFIVSSANGLGTGDLLDEIDKYLKEDVDEVLLDLPRFAIVGRPNAGKSSIINAFMDEDRHIVTNLPGTTRDSIYVRYNKFGHDFYLIDTAGIRKKAKVFENTEYYSVLRAIRAIESADICILMVDATRGLESQDLNIFSIIQKNRKGLVVCVNKWDLITAKSSKDIKNFEEKIRNRLAPFTDFPIVFTSAITKQRIFKIIETAEEVYINKQKRITTAKLNDFFLPLIENYPPPAYKGKYIKIKYVAQLPQTQVPTFVFFANLPQYIKQPYLRFLENKLRETWDFHGTPILLFPRKK